MSINVLSDELLGGVGGLANENDALSSGLLKLPAVVRHFQKLVNDDEVHTQGSQPDMWEQMD